MATIEMKYRRNLRLPEQNFFYLCDIEALLCTDLDFIEDQDTVFEIPKRLKLKLTVSDGREADVEVPGCDVDMSVSAVRNLIDSLNLHEILLRKALDNKTSK